MVERLEDIIALAVANTISIVHDHSVQVGDLNVLANDTDADNDTLTASLVSNPSHGMLMLYADGTFSYTPNTGVVAQDSFTYKANDGTSDSNTATVTINITNSAPTLNNQGPYYGHQNTYLTVSVANGLQPTDADGDSVSLSVVSNPSHGWVMPSNDGSFIYSPDTDYSGADSFTIKANDGIADSSTITVVIEISHAPTTFGNLIPLEVVRNNLTQPIDLSEFASDADDDELVITIVSQPSHGELIAIGGSVYVYASTGTFTGQESFSFKANDGVGDSNTATFYLNVTNTAPTAADTGTYLTLKNHSVDVIDLATYGRDYSTNTFTTSIVDGPVSGQLTDLGNGKYRYTPNTNYVGSDYFTYKLNDGVADSMTATASISVVDQAIVGNGVRLPISGLEASTISPTLLLAGAQSVLSSPNFEVTSISTPALGQITANADGTWTYAPPENATTTFQEDVTVSISDGTNTTSFCLALLAPDRQPAGPPPVHPERQFRAANMGPVTTLFPAGINLALYNNMNAAEQAGTDAALIASIHQGFVGGDSAVASNMIQAIQLGGFRALERTVVPTLAGNGQVNGYDVRFEQRVQGVNVVANTVVHVGIPTLAQRGVFGYAGGGFLGLSLWYTVIEMAYVQQYRGPNVQVAFTTIGNFTQPVGDSAESLTAMLRIPVLANLANTRSYILANIAQGAIINLLNDPLTFKTASTLALFDTQQKQTAAADLGIDPGHNYAVVGYNATDAIVTLRNPHNRDGLGGREFTITLADFKLLFASTTTGS